MASFICCITHFVMRGNPINLFYAYGSVGLWLQGILYISNIYFTHIWHQYV